MRKLSLIFIVTIVCLFTTELNPTFLAPLCIWTRIIDFCSNDLLYLQNV